MSNNESKFHYKSKLIVKKWVLELSKLDILPIFEFPVTEDNLSFKCKDEYETFFLYTPEAWIPSRRKDVFDDGFDEIDYIFDWNGVQWWQKDSPPTYEQLINLKKQVYVIFDIGLISEYEFCVDVPFLNPQHKDDLTKTDSASMLLGAIEIEYTHSHTSNKKKFIDKLPFEVLDLTTDEILVSPAVGKSKLSFYLEELATIYR
jgi:hypothetical protein